MSAPSLRPHGAGHSGQHRVRAANRALVLQTVRRLAPCSRAEAAAACGLTKSTMSSIVADLLTAGLLRESGTATAQRPGRPGRLIEPDRTRCAVLGAEVNVDYIALSVIDPSGGQLLTLHQAFDTRAAGPADTAAHVAEFARAALTRPEAAGRTLLGAGIAVPGLVAADGSGVLTAPALGWTGVDLAGLVAAHSADLPPDRVLIGNDATFAVFAEHRFGHLSGTADLVYITGEVGIGAGLLSGGRPLHGARGHVGEIGHVPLAADGPPCACGRRGCLEALAGLAAVLDRTAPDLAPADGPDTIARAASATARRAASGDPAVLAALHDAGHWIGRGASILVNLLDPSAVLLGGYYADLAPWLLPAAEEVLTEQVFAPTPVRGLIQPSALGLTAAAKGGAAAVMRAIDDGALPLPVPRAGAH